VARRPLSLEERKTRVRVLVFVGVVGVIVLLVVASVAVFGAFLERFGTG
jgi:hypothetical protein